MRVHGELRVPGDKSLSHRALIFAALAEGESRVKGLLQSADVHSTASVLRALGVALPELSSDVHVAGRGLHALRQSASALDCGNSGTTSRLMSGVLAASLFRSRVIGDESLSRRPMRRVARPLTEMGARFEFERGDGLPMTIVGGRLQGIEWSTETASAQTKSAILLAGLVGGVEVSVREPAPSRDHTERMLAALGVPVERSECLVRTRPVGTLPPLTVTVPGDPSSAAFFAALAALSEQGELTLPGVCLNRTRTGFFRALTRLGARLAMEQTGVEAGEPVGVIRASGGQLHGITLEGGEVPSMIDEIPLLACLAARAEGETVITGAEELRVKESDRIATVVANLRALGVEADELLDGMRIVGSRRPLVGQVRTLGDHRIAMGFGILGALDNSRIAIDDRHCVSVSYPEFWRDLTTAVA
jgi:3-phosphoshikimate 1-carboxyvinyltransferase